MQQLDEVVGAGPLLLDFDGPICAMFAGLPAPLVAADLVRVVTPLADPPGMDDPLAVLRWADEHGSPALTAAVEEALIAAELVAAGRARPTPYAREVLAAARAKGVPVAVVSNNSAAAIELYLARQGLTGYVDAVVGRPRADPRRMKPDPGPVLDAIEAVGSTPSRCTLIGDSLTDIEAARAAGVAVIGYANKPWKIGAFTHADAVITSMSEVVAALI
ncbi:HAD family hydrolase [Paractinoplanes abujensis]|uniref:HAD superfamily hydrolase (TIGR01662 family) n=1 Tax=Paractinoplanes abujensis TaxID=882441 RepID=A0A7W7G368_9ACTN|nr:HAD family hydrolase [Actinoplanes abujensis]MBB4696023.1 HAD superfamily hydrolase (TIGR01662 family) [Actinoplanes abujensis]